MHAQTIAENRTKVKHLVLCTTAWYRGLGKWQRSAPAYIWLVVALLLAMAVRLPALGRQSLWIDEGNTYIRVALPLNLVLENLLAVRNQTPLLLSLTAIMGGAAWNFRVCPAIALHVVRRGECSVDISLRES